MGQSDYSGNVSPDRFPLSDSTHRLSAGSGNLVGVDPMLDPNGLQNNGGPTATIALRGHEPRHQRRLDPETLFTDQRGYAPRSGLSGTDIGPYQYRTSADTQAPTAASERRQCDRGECRLTQSLHLHDHVR